MLKKILYPVFKLKGHFSLLFFAAIFKGIFALYSVNLLKNITDLIQSGDEKMIINTVIYFAIVVFLLFIVGFGNEFIIISTSKNVKNTIYQKYIKQFITLDNSQTETVGTGKLIAKIQSGINAWKEVIIFGIGFTSENVFRIFFSVIYVYISVPKYFYYFTMTLIAMAYFGYLMNKISLKYRDKAVDLRNLQTKQLVKILSSKFEILQNNKQDKEISILKSYTNNEAKHNIKSAFWIGSMFRVPRIGVEILKILNILFIGIGVIKGFFTLGEFIAVSSILLLLTDNIVKLTWAYMTIGIQYIDVKKMINLFDEIPQIKGYNTGKELNFKNGDIKIKNITFGYGDSSVLNNFSLDIKGGKQIAIVGVSGSGKTTLMKLISGYLKANKGEIYIDGQELSKTSLKSYYKNIGYLTQEPGVIDDTIKENLVYGLDRQITKKELEDVIKISECEFINDFDKGLETIIGERGIKLSGGQRQRLAIAKILLKNPKIIVLDEPTSALDSFSEEKITKAFEKLFEGRTVIIVAHRLQTVKKSDEIIVMNEGKIIERGNHKELSSIEGNYAKMLRLQSLK